MGLDNYASRNKNTIELHEEDVRAFEEAGINLCGGMMSDGTVSFRGKVYDELITDITSVSLYTDWISPKTVKRICLKLEQYDPEKVKNDSNSWRYQNTPDEVRMLQKFFHICAERGIGIVGWS